MKKHQISLLIVLMFVTVFVFYPVLKAGFINLDDRAMVTENWKIRSFAKDNLKALLFEPHYKLYHPILNLSFAAEYKLFGADPYFYHAGNLLLHMLNILLVFFIFRIISGGNFFTAFLSAFIFTCHPLHVEPVAWVSGRKDILYAFFFLSSLCCYLKAGYSKNGRILIVSSVFLFLCACLSKSMAVTLPAVMILCDWMLGKKFSKKMVLIYTAYFAAALFFSALTYMLYYTAAQKGDLTLNALAANFIAAHFNLLFYLSKFICPSSLSPLYPYFFNYGLEIPDFIIKAPFLVYAFILLAIFSLKHTKKIFFGAFFFIITVLPVINILPTGIASVADRYVYIPIAGLAYLAACGAYFIYAKAGKTYLKAVLLSVLACVLIPMCLASRAYCKKWTDTKTLFDDIIKKYPGEMSKPYSIRGVWYAEHGNQEEAQKDLERALIINPDSNIMFYIAGIKKDTKEYDEALQIYDSIPPNNVNGMRVFMNKALIYHETGSKEKAYQTINEGIKLYPKEYLLYLTAALFYGKDGDFDGAYDNFEKAKEINPYAKSIYINAAKTYEGLDKSIAAEKEYIEGIGRLGNDKDLLDGLGELYFNLTLLDKAEKVFESAVRIFPEDYRAYDHLGMIASLKKDPDKALYYFTLSLLINGDYRNAYLHRAGVHLSRGNNAKAAEDIRRARTLGFDVPEEYKTYFREKNEIIL